MFIILLSGKKQMMRFFPEQSGHGAALRMTQNMVYQRHSERIPLSGRSEESQF